jgi:hypothetical protein
MRRSRAAANAGGSWPCGTWRGTCNTVQMGSTPSSSRLESMNATITSVGGGAPPGRTLLPAARFIRPVKLSDLLLQLLHPLSLDRRTPSTMAVIDLCLGDPGPDRLDPVAELGGYALHRPMLLAGLGPDLAGQTDRLLLLLTVMPTRCRRHLRIAHAPASLPRSGVSADPSAIHLRIS